MKSIICSVLITHFFVAAFILPGIDTSLFHTATKDEVNRRFHAQEPLVGNITLTSNSTLGSGAYAFVLSGKTNDGTPVAIKCTTTQLLEVYIEEYNCFEKMNATKDKTCLKYGIPFIHHCGDFLQFKTMAMTMLDSDLYSFHRKVGNFSRDSILIIFRDMIKTLKFMHSKGIIHQDITPDNIMIKGANVFLMDFNRCEDKKIQHKDLMYNHDMLSLFTTMSYFEASFGTLTIVRSEDSIIEKKQQIKELLYKNFIHIELVEPYLEYFSEAVEAIEEKRLPKYDYLYKMFDDLLYTGRNRSQRIVFEWLTTGERAAAMAETILPIESIIFPGE